MFSIDFLKIYINQIVNHGIFLGTKVISGNTGEDKKQNYRRLLFLT